MPVHGDSENRKNRKIPLYHEKSVHNVYIFCIYVNVINLHIVPDGNMEKKITLVLTLLHIPYMSQ